MTGKGRAFQFVMAGHRALLRHGRARPGHPRLWCCNAAKTWMPGIKPGMTGERFVAGMTGERQCVSIHHGRTGSGDPLLRHGRTCRTSRVYPTCASSFNSQVGQARLAVPSPPRHGRTCSGHPRLYLLRATKTWMPGIKPGMTVERFVAGMTGERQCVSIYHGRTCSGHPRLYLRATKTWMPGIKPGITAETCRRIARHARA